MLHAGVSHGQQAQLEAVHRRALLQDRDGFFAEGAVVVDQGDVLAFELVDTTGLLADVLDDHVAGHPIGACEREVPLEHATVSRFAAAVTCGDQGDLVAWGFFGQGKGDAGGQRLEHGRAAVLALQALIALHATVGGVAGFAFFKRHLHAVDAAARIDQLEVVDIAVRKGHAVGGVSACAVDQHGEELLFGLGRGHGADQRTGKTGSRHRGGQDELTKLHGLSPVKKR